MYEYSHMGGFGIAMGLFWIFVFAAVIWLVVGMVNRRPMADSNQGPESALDLLKKRYVLGEVNDEECQRRKKILEEK